MQVSAQSWQGLAPDDDERYRLATTAEGGIWLLRTPHPEPVTALAGNRPVLDTSRRLLGVPRWGHEGSSRLREEPVVDSALIRRLEVGQAAYIYHGGVTFVQVKRLLAAPAALAKPPAAGHRAPHPAAAAAGDQARRPSAAWPASPPGAPLPADATAPAGQPAVTAVDVAALLDEAFGAEPR